MVRAVWSPGLVAALDEARMTNATGEAVRVEAMPLLVMATISKDAKS